MSAHSKQVFAWTALIAAGLVAGLTPQTHAQGDSQSANAQAGAEWTLRPATSPTPRAGHAMAYDSARGVTVLFGGDAVGPDAETWELTGVCYPDCDVNGILDIFDFLYFQNSFVLGEPYACDCDPDPVCDVFDFLCFQSAFVSGCP